LARHPRDHNPVPSKEQVIAFVAERSGKVAKREIARAFGLSGSDRVALNAVLRELSEEGQLAPRRRKLHHAGVLPRVVLAEMVGRDADGDLLAAPAEWDEERHGTAPRIRIVATRRPRRADAAGIGDRALIRIEEVEADNGIAHQGRIIKLIHRVPHRILGIFRELPGGGGRLTPVDKKQLGKEWVIPAEATHDARDGDLVAAEVGRPSGGRVGGARVRERLGSMNSERAVALIAIHAHGIPQEFPPAALAEATAAGPADLSLREDWRQVPFVTIDPADAKDHDDAVHALADTDPNNPGGFVISVAIADVAHYVERGSALDREALLRGNSVYFPDRVVPMLPERISSDLCSLKAGVDRPAIAVRIVIGADGRKRGHAFHRVLIRSAARLHYGQVQEAIDGRPDEATQPLVALVLEPLYAAYGALKRARNDRSPLELDLPERKIVLKPDGTVDRVTTPLRLEAHRLIEEFMILANVAAAETLEQTHSPLIYRVHDEPDPEKVAALREFLRTLDISLPRADVLHPSDFNHVLAKARGTEFATLIHEVVLRTQAQAEYAAENYGHFGLNLRRYAHFTSPIRRYADLVVHRALIRALKLGHGGLPDNEDRVVLGEIAALITAAERRAMMAERETIDRLTASFLADRVGATFEGRIGGVTRAGLFVRLDETGADGFIPARTIGNEYFRYHEAAHALIGEGSGESYRLGDAVTVRLAEAVPLAGALRFELLSEGRLDPGRKRSKRAEFRRSKHAGSRSRRADRGAGR
jgi:ribonuclease R